MSDKTRYKLLTGQHDAYEDSEYARYVVVDIEQEVELSLTEVVKRLNETRPSAEWIPVSEGLPEATNYYDVTVIDVDTNAPKVTVLLWRGKQWSDFWLNGVHWMLGTYWEEGNGKIIAWKPKAEPYVPEPSDD